MNFLKRCLLSIRCKWWKNLFIVVLFTVLFAVAVGGLTLYGTAKAQTDHLQTALGNAVTLKGVTFSYRGGGGYRMMSTMLPEDTVETFVNSEEVDAYNFAEFAFLTFPEAQGVYKELWPEIGGMMFPQYTVRGNAVVDTSLDQAFTVYGFQLEEGKHLSKKTIQDHVCLVSREFAECNDLAVGDSFQVETANVSDSAPLPLKILGIFSAPESDTLKGSGSRPEDMLFITPAACYDVGENKKEM